MKSPHRTVDPMASAPFISMLQMLLWLLLFVTVTLTYADPDLWGHVRFGQDILSTQTLPSRDPYSFTQDRSWVNHEWLSEVAMAISYQRGGTLGLVVLKLSVVGLALLIIFRRLSSTLPPVVHAAAFTLIVWGAFPLTTTVRPQLWTFLGLAAVTTILVTNRRRWWLPVIFAVWANLHGGWIVGLGVVWLWTLAELRERPRLRNLAAAAAATGATLINPYGWGLWRFVGETVRLGREGISEWQPLWVSPIVEWAPWLIIVAAALWIRPRRVGTWLILAGFAVAAAKVSRLMPLFVEVSVILLAADWAWPVPVPPVTARTARGPLVINAVAVSVLAAAVLVRTLPYFTSLPIEPQWAADPGIVQALKQRHGRLAVEFNWGEYAIWHLGPNIRVSIDGRRETIYSDVTLTTQRSLALGRPQGLEWLSMTKPEYLWFDASRTALKAAVEKQGYRVDVDTPHSFVAVRADLPRITRDGAMPTTVCFP